MKIRIVSDLHFDYNIHTIGKDFEYGFERNLKDTDLLLIAGDTGSNDEIEAFYLKRLGKKLKNTIVACVAGNHLGYNTPKNFVGTSYIEHMRLNLRRRFCDKPIYYLENEYFQLQDYIIAGCTLYTDFSLYKNPEKDGQVAMSYINDFRYVHTIDYEEGLIKPVHYTDYIKWHKKSIEFIEKLCEKFPNKKIILLTHFLVTPKSISKKYVDNILNPFYCTDLENLILKYPNIKLVASGHSHEKNISKIGDTPIILSPYGYFGRETQMHPSKYFGKIVDI